MSNIGRTEREAKAVLDAEAWPTGPLTPREKHFIRLLGEMREDRDRWRDNAQGAVARAEAADAQAGRWLASSSAIDQEYGKRLLKALDATFGGQ